MMESADGRAWNVLPPAPMLWPKGMETVSHFEYGGCERINGKYFMMRRKGQTDAFHSACIALGRSKDLVHWEVGDPCCTPNRFNCFEVPDVFKLGEKWYLIALTGDGYGQSHRWSDPNITCATVVFQADRPEGPFEEVKENLLLASTGQQGYSARTVERHGERLMFYTRPSEPFARLAWPVKLGPRPEGGLNPTYWPGLDKAFASPQSQPPAEITTSQDRVLQPLPGLSTNDSTFMIRATVELKAAQAAGFAFGQTENQPGFVATLSTKGGPTGQVSLARMPDGPIQNRHWPIQPGDVHKLRPAQEVGDGAGRDRDGRRAGRGTGPGANPLEMAGAGAGYSKV